MLVQLPHYPGTNGRAVLYLVAWDVSTGEVRRVSSPPVLSYRATNW